MANLIDGKSIAADVKAAVKERCDALKARGVQPSLAVILVGEDPASKVYVRNKARACKDCGIVSHVIRMSEDTTQQELLDQIHQINADLGGNPLLINGNTGAVLNLGLLVAANAIDE